MRNIPNIRPKTRCCLGQHIRKYEELNPENHLSY